MSENDRPRATIADVARLAGVSKGTVSHVLNGRVAVSDDLRGRVAAAIAALNYEPAETARSLTSRKRLSEWVDRRPRSWPRLTAIGYVSVDLIAPVGRLPTREERMMAPEIVKAIGGPAANVAAVAAGIGGDFAVAASLITALGADQDSDWAVAELAGRNVEIIQPRERRQGRLDRAIVLVEADGARTIVNEPSRLAEFDVERFVGETAPDGPLWCLHFEGYQVPRQIGVVELARRRGFRLSMQATGLPPEWLAANAERLFAAFDAVILHRENLPTIPGCPTDADAACEWLSARAASAGAAWPAVVIVTLGAEGAFVVERGGAPSRARALDVAVCDRTGAGDALAGAFLALWLNGSPSETALRYACAAGSLATTRLGAQEVRPSADDLVAALSRAAAGSSGAPARAAAS
ncbi:PfkB family carbohydrate kinase [Jiella sp. M17.18]|uniref:PfkB family carbohydrate kinase n=1 Tax=Jiella sp. M17.18 TaxID=3234247 RepID=UPI0034DFE2D4